MKICFIGSARSIHVQRWVKWFVEKGHEVHLITPSYAEIEGVKIHKIGGKDSSITNFVRKMFQTRQLVKKIKPDILHAHYVFGYGTFGAFANYHPFVVSAWGSDVLREHKESFIKRYVIKHALKKADMVTTTAKFMGKYLAKGFGLPENKIVRIPWGIDLKIFHRGYEEEVKKLREKLEIKDNSLVIISNRHLSPKYEIQTIIESAPYVIKKHSNMVFVFIRGYGEPTFEDKMRTIAEKLGIIKNIRFVSRFVSPEEMVVFLNMSDILISIPKTDQFASSVMEGMACGTIPVVSNIEAYKQYLKDEENAFFINPDDSKELTEKTIYCIEHPKIKERFYEINKKIIEENEDWSRNAIKMEELYAKIIEERML